MIHLYDLYDLYDLFEYPLNGFFGTISGSFYFIYGYYDYGYYEDDCLSN